MCVCVFVCVSVCVCVLRSAAASHPALPGPAGHENERCQVAYELLLAHKNEELQDDASLAEFVDQCKVS